MTTLILGLDPGDFGVVLSEGADFISGTVEYLDESDNPVNWPTGTSLTLEVGEPGQTPIATWAATISGAIAMWTVDKADTAAAKVPAQTKVRMRFVNGSTDRVLYTGRVRRND